MGNRLAADAQAFLREWNGPDAAPSFKSRLRLWVLTPGFHLVMLIRLQGALGRVPLIGAGLRRLVWYWTTVFFSCDIDPLAEIGPGLYIPHPIGIVVGGGVRIGASVTILQNVTLGRQGKAGNEPTIGDNVSIGAGACIFGRITVGDGGKVGANSVVTHDVAAETVVAGVAAYPLTRKAVPQATTDSQT